MAGVKGRSGTNKGKDKPFAEALRMEIAAAGTDHKALRAIARGVLETAQDRGHKDWMASVNMIADRLDGKPVQESNVTVHRTVAELSDEEIAARIAELRGTGASDGDSAAACDPSKLN